MRLHKENMGVQKKKLYILKLCGLCEPTRPAPHWGGVVISQIGYAILLSDNPFHLTLSVCHHN